MSVRIMAFAGALAGTSALCFAGTCLTESITGSAGDWTYTYTLTNEEALPIYNWAVWFPSDPLINQTGSDTVTPGTANWSATHLPSQGFFPKASLDLGHDIRDSNDNTLVGPNGEPGLYQTFATDFVSGNSGEYWDGDSWKSLPPDPLSLPDNDPIWNQKWRGEYYGWDGSGADIQTSYGIATEGGTGQLVLHSTANDAVTGLKGFSFSTTDYWYNTYDPRGTPDGGDDILYFEFEASDTMIPEPFSVATLFMAVGGLGMYYRRKRRIG